MNNYTSFPALKFHFTYIVLFILFLLPIASSAQIQNFESLLDKVEGDLLGYNLAEALKTIDSALLETPVSIQQKHVLKALKVQALVSSELFEEALIVSTVVLRADDCDRIYRIRVFLQRALLFEIQGKLDKAEVELKDVDALYEDPTTVKDDIYGEYLYRKSSFYRVKGEDSLALDYAERSYAFGLESNYKGVMAVSSMLIGFLNDKIGPESEIEYYKRALGIWKSFGDQHGTSGMYAAIGRIQKEMGNIDLAFKYNDSLLEATKKRKDFYLQGFGFLQRSELFESLGERDSALHYYKEYKTADEEYSRYKKNIGISQLDYHFEIEKEAVRRNQALSDLAQSKRYNLALWIFLSIVGLALIVVAFLHRKIIYRNKRINEQNDDFEQVNSQLNKTVHQKELLLQELNHRVKNNLSLILSLINFQQEEVHGKEKEKFLTLQSRIETIALAHEQFIYNEQQVGEAKFELSNYINTIAESLVQLNPETTVYNQFIPPLKVTIDTAMPLGILVNELINNSIKHAQPKGDLLTIDLTIDQDKDDTLYLHYIDTGSDFQVEENKDSLGLFIIESMIAQLDGAYKREGSEYKCELKIK